ncbi:hypothetical protein CES85_5368 [Ochrobactrum quorumnocens]|uniref:Uncharacterized protein n=1 Tax=Ochrobactrum quorumnocens TaxID=271865 RepID=A0A248UCM1_9HYPH|nr:hypothetical protein CES85_5368 [[Ochrobactrum] quorumnocens]
MGVFHHVSSLKVSFGSKFSRNFAKPLLIPGFEFCILDRNTELLFGLPLN